MKLYLIQFLHKHFEFRIPGMKEMVLNLKELESLAILENIKIKFEQSEYSESHPFLLVRIENNLNAITLIRRSMLIKNISEFWGAGENLRDLTEKLKKYRHPNLTAYLDSSFKFLVSSFGRTISLQEQVERINNFKWMELRGPIRMIQPDVEFAYFELYTPQNPLIIKCYFGVLLAEGTGNALVKTYDLKKRNYLGTTSMDAELSLVTANQALAKPGKIIYDPFVGTGSFLVSCSHFGAFSIGSDIDGRKIRGVEDGKGIEENLTQYKLNNLVLGTLSCDIAHHCWRPGPWFDAIVTDPPYGVREGAKKIASTNQSAFKKNGEKRYPKTEPYEMSAIISDLIAFAAAYLAPGGRLVFWLPTVNDHYQPQDIPTHPSLRLIANSEQNFGQWSRRLITMEKSRDTMQFFTEEVSKSSDEKPGHFNFRNFYFSKKV